MQMFLKVSAVALLLVVLSFPFNAQAQSLQHKVMCVWDPVGTHGPVYSFFFDLKVKMISWGIDLEMLAYESEIEALSLLEQGKCDISVVTAILARDYVNFGGTLDAIGGITDQKELQTLLASLTSKKLTPALSQGNHEIVGVLPLGAMYAFVNNKKISSVANFKRKKIAALNGDVQIKKLAYLAGAKPVKTTISDFADLFKTDQIDIVLMPALAYNAFELDDGIRQNGGIIDIRFFNGMLQAISNKDRFDADFGAQMRTYMYTRMNDILKLIKTAEEEIPEHYWIKTDPEKKAELVSLSKDIRLQLLLDEKLNRKALSFLWRIRCKVNPNNEECEMPKENTI